MNPESPKEEAPVYDLREHNTLQIELARRFYGRDDSEKLALEWIPKYSKRFREIVMRRLQENHHLYEELKEPAAREEFLAAVEDELYETEEVERT